MGLLSYFKENKKLKKQVNDLEFSIRANKIMMDKMQREHEKQVNDLEFSIRANKIMLDEMQREHAKEIQEKNSLIESLNSKIDILHKYYDIDKEPTQEVKTAMRIDERIHDLELENIRLNSYISCLSSMHQNMLSRINYPNGGIVYV